MIRSFGSKDTERIWHEQYVKRVDRTVQRATLRKLELIYAARDVRTSGSRWTTVWSDSPVIAVVSTASEPTRSGVSASSREVNVQSNYELRLERRRVGDTLDAIAPLRSA